MVLTKEIKNIGYSFIITEIVLFLIAIILSIAGTATMLDTMSSFFELAITLIAAVYSTYMVYNSGDMEMLISYKKSMFHILFQKYIAIIGTLVLLALVQIGIIISVTKNMNEISKFFGFVPTTLLMSSFAVLVTVLFRNTSIGLTLTIAFFPIQYYLGYNLSLRKLPDWYEYFSFFDTTFMFNSPIWLTNRILLICISIVLWVLLYLLLQNRKWQSA